MTKTMNSEMAAVTETAERAVDVLTAAGFKAELGHTRDNGWKRALHVQGRTASGYEQWFTLEIAGGYSGDTIVFNCANFYSKALIRWLNAGGIDYSI